MYCGVLTLGTDGCGQFWALVVHGPQFGKVWMLADVGITPTVPALTFLWSGMKLGSTGNKIGGIRKGGYEPVSFRG